MRTLPNKLRNAGRRKPDVSAVPSAATSFAEQSAFCPACNTPVMHAENSREGRNVIAPATCQTIRLPHRLLHLIHPSG